MKDTFKKTYANLRRFRFSRKTRSIVRNILISLTTIVVVLAVAFGIVWHYRGRIFKNFATGYVQTLADSKSAANGETLSDLANADTNLPSVFSDQALVESAVSSANPAVVAITVSEEEPNYTTSYQNVDPFSQMFGGTDPFGGSGFNIQVPTQTPDGTSEQEVGAGSGFLVSADGLIVTNKHVVAATDATYTVYLSDGKKYPAKVLARDTLLDVAVIKITPPIGVSFPYLTLGDSSSLQLGQSVIAIGNALGQFQNTVSVGVVSGLSRSITAGDESGTSSEDLSDVIQTDAAINPGNSGGPLLDLSGQVVGMDTAIVQGSENIGFALPINELKTVIDSVESTGKIIRPYLGIRYIQIDVDVQTAKNLSVDYGDLVSAGQDAGSDPAVIAGSPAAKAGIKAGDIILEVDGVKLDSTQDLSEIVRDHKAGDTIDLTVLSGGAQKDVKVTLEAAPAGQ